MQISDSVKRALPRLAAAALALATVAPAAHSAAQQTVTFRAGVDLVAVEAQVIDKDGEPVGNLSKENFQVWINGQARKVVSADLIQYPLTAPRSLAPTQFDSPNSVPRNDLPSITGRVIILAIDEVSFSLQTMPPVIEAIKKFLGTLSPDDVVAAFPYPFGTGRIDLTHYHNQIALQLSRVQGVRQMPAPTDIFMTPSEAIDVAAGDSFAFQSVYERECLVSQGRNGCVDKDGDGRCAYRVRGEANSYVGYIESISSESFAGIRELLRTLQVVSGPKTIVMVSAGLTTSDRTGGRPDVTGMMTQAGKLAAAANATLYVLHFDNGLLETFSAMGARNQFNPCQTNVSNAFTGQSRDQTLSAYGLQRIAGEAGGEYLRITAGTGELALQRVLKETSAYYVLGVQPEDTDRDGRTHFIRVKTQDAAKGATVRARTQVTIPKAGGS